MKKKPEHKKLVRDVALLGAMILVNKLAHAMEQRRPAKDSEEILKRKLTIASLLYHAIGIVYNE